MRLLDDDEGINPALSVVNLVDVFLVVIAALLIAIAQNPLNPFMAEDVTVIKNAGKENMEIIVKKGEKIESFKAKETRAVAQDEKLALPTKWMMVALFMLLNKMLNLYLS